MTEIVFLAVSLLCTAAAAYGALVVVRSAWWRHHTSKRGLRRFDQSVANWMGTIAFGYVAYDSGIVGWFITPVLIDGGETMPITIVLVIVLVGGLGALVTIGGVFALVRAMARLRTR